MKNLIIIIVGLTIVNFCNAQQDSIPGQQLDTVYIKNKRIAGLLQQIPAAIGIYRATEQDAIRQQLSLQEYVKQIPGVFTQNTTNFAQDLRVSIRGFGARSSFGIRGVKLIVDGIPETTPDGQGQLDNLNLGIIDRIEVLKGPSSSLYGNASGGVIDVSTRGFNENKPVFSDWKAIIGAFGFQNYQVTAGLGNADANYTFHANYGISNGYRDQSSFEQISTNFKGQFRFRESVNLTTIVNYSDSPVAQDPGGLTLEEVTENRRQARQRNIDFKTEEAVNQFKLGLNLNWEKTKATQIDGYAFYSNRRFDGKLPFEFGGIVDLNRDYVGQGTSITYTKKNNRLKAGYDFGYQNDTRKRFRNLEGEIGEQTLNQKERFTNLGVYVIDHIEFDAWYITGGLRYDYNNLEAVDSFLSNGDDSGDINLSALSGNVGVSYAFAKALTPYVNISTSFETPALSELSANPSGAQGFNKNLEAQKATNFELGFRGDIGTLQYNVVGFLINTQDDLVPFELAEFPDREFYRNAGETKRLGIEVTGEYAFAKAWKAIVSYALSEFTYEDFEIENQNLVGNFLPGIPKHTTNLAIHFLPENGLHASVTASLVGSQFANDGNTVEVEGYELVNLRAGYSFNFRKTVIRPYLGINNLLDQAYTDNVRINAFGRRFYEPAPGFNVYGGVIVRL